MDDEREREVMLALQRALLPAALPALDAVALSASYEPASAPALPGGDFYDALVLGNGTLALVVGDAEGTGRDAILAMNVARLGLRAALLDGCRPVEALRRANALLRISGPGRLVSATIALLDPTTLLLRYACAGHVPPMVASDEGTLSLPGSGTGIPLGVVEEHLAVELVADIPEGALGALLTSGALAPEGALADGLAAFADALAAARALAIPGAARAIDRARFADRPRAHDAAILTFRPAATLDALAIRLPAEPGSTSHARVALRRYLRGSGMDERRAYDALVAVGEAIANAVEHAYGAHTERRFSVTGHNDGAQLTIVVRDNGRWREASPESGRGRGIPLMRELADRCAIATDDEGTSVTLTFALGPNVADAALAPALGSGPGAGGD